MTVALAEGGGTALHGAHTAQAGWLAGPRSPLFGVLHMPAGGGVTGAVVLCPPIQFEYYNSHSAYRLLAESLAGAGLAALRFDYTGTGDSGGDPESVADVAVWLDDIRAAVTALREAGAPRVGLVGMRIGATLAHAAGAGADFEVAWDPCLTGRRYLREATLLAHQVVDSRSEVLQGSDEDGARIIGYDFPVSFADSLSGLRLQAGGPVPHPTLLLTRDGELPKALAAWNGPLLEVARAEGQEQLIVAQLDQTVDPVTTIAAITGWCRRTAGGAQVPLASAVSPTVTLSGAGDAVVNERVTAIGRSGLFAIATEPVGPSRLTVLCFNSGAQHRIGPNRLWVDAARALAPEGVRTVRLDFRTIGDSPRIPGLRDSLYWPATIDDLEDVVAELSTVPGPVGLVGLCSGAYHSLEAASRFPVRGVMAIHPVLDLGTMNNRPELADRRRRIWIRDRAWVRAMNRFDLARAVKWKLPSWFWAAADRLGLQPEPTTGIRALAERDGTDVVLVMEVSWVLNKRLFRLKRAPFDRLTIEMCVGDHALVSVPARKAVLESLVRHALSWRSPAV